jgi:hypothetical protein
MVDQPGKVQISYRVGFQWLAAVCLLLLLSTSMSFAAKSKKAELQVSLFGQPCVLSGPVSPATLKALHAISPEQTPPPSTGAQARQVLEQLKKGGTTVPAFLERYREKLRRWFQAQAAFHDSLAEARKSGKADALATGTREHLLPRQAESFSAKVKAEALPPSSWTESTVDQLKAAYDVSIDPMPEEEFHRVIEKAGIRYQCDFGDAEGEGEE